LQFDINPSLARYDRNRLANVVEAMIARIESVPGVRSATFSCCGNNFMSSTDNTSGRTITGQILWVWENFFETMGVPLRTGRALTARDAAGTPEVVVVNEAFVRQHHPNDTPIGKTAKGEIIGVVADTPFGSLRRGPGPVLYWPYRQGGAYGRLTFRVRTNIDAMAVLPAIRDSIQQIEPLLPISNVRTLTEQIIQGLPEENMFAGLSTLFGILAVILTCVGFYGLMAYSVARRTNEIGLRMALGATRPNVLRLVMSEGLLLVAIGGAIGVAGALASTRYIERILFGLPPNDILTIAAAVLLMIAVAAVAAFLPARRASRVDPLVALRYE
jgi:predicted permease